MSSVTTETILEAINAPRECVAAIGHMGPKIIAWQSLYRNDPVELTLSLIDGEHKRVRRSMGMAKRVAEDWASLIWTENTQVVAGEDESPEHELLESVFSGETHSEIADFIEHSFALGTGCIDILIDGLTVSEATGQITATSEDTTIALDYTEATAMVPLRWTRGDVTAVALLSWDGMYLDVRYHFDEGTEQVIENRRFVTTGDRKLEEVELPEGVMPRLVIIGAPRLFAIMRPAIANNYDRRSPFGVSVYGNATSQLSFVDEAFDNMAEDIHLGGKIVFIPDTMLRRSDVIDSATGKPRLVPPQKDKRNLFVALDDSIGGDSKIHEHNPDLRVSDNQLAVDAALGMVSVACGLGTERYRYRGETIATATQVISENSDLFRNRKRHLRAVSATIGAIATAVVWLGANVLGLYPFDPEVEVTVRGDDSVIEDDNARLDRGMRLVGAGLISTKRFLTEYLGMNDDEADTELEAISGAAEPLFTE